MTATNFDHELFLQKTKKIFYTHNKRIHIRTYTKFIRPIVKHLVAGEELPYQLKQWINSKKSAYNNNRSMSKEVFDVLEELIPLLGYDWKVKAERKRLTFEDRLLRLKEELASGKNFGSASTSYHWLSKQRKLYEYQQHLYPKAHIEALDALIPLLGFNWRKEKKAFPKLTFEERITEITSFLKSGNTITIGHRYYAWLIRQRNSYLQSDSQSPYPQAHQKALDELIPLLGYDWKIKKTKKPLSFEDRVEEIRSVLESGESIKIGSKYYAWLLRQRQLYNHKYTSTPYPKAQKEALDALIPLLGYDWKVSRKRKNKITFEQRLEELKAFLETGQPITIGSPYYTWLSKERKIYQKLKKSYPQHQKEALDALIPALGADWKVLQNRKDLYFKRKLNNLSTFLANGGTITPEDAHYRWLVKQQKLYVDAMGIGPSYSKTYKEALDALIPSLGFDWKKIPDKSPRKSSRKLTRFTFEERVEEIREYLKTGATIEVGGPFYGWLSQQRNLYRDTFFNKPFPKAHKKALNTLIPYLGYDWKLYKRERSEGVTIR